MQNVSIVLSCYWPCPILTLQRNFRYSTHICTIKNKTWKNSRLYQYKTTNNEELNEKLFPPWTPKKLRALVKVASVFTPWAHYVKQAELTAGTSRLTARTKQMSEIAVPPFIIWHSTKPVAGVSKEETGNCNTICGNSQTCCEDPIHDSTTSIWNQVLFLMPRNRCFLLKVYMQRFMT